LLGLRLKGHADTVGTSPFNLAGDSNIIMHNMQIETVWQAFG